MNFIRDILLTHEKTLSMGFCMTEERIGYTKFPTECVYAEYGVLRWMLKNNAPLVVFPDTCAYLVEKDSKSYMNSGYRNLERFVANGLIWTNVVFMGDKLRVLELRKLPYLGEAPGMGDEIRQHRGNPNYLRGWNQITYCYKLEAVYLDSVTRFNASALFHMRTKFLYMPKCETYATSFAPMCGTAALFSNCMFDTLCVTREVWEKMRVGVETWFDDARLNGVYADYVELDEAHLEDALEWAERLLSDESAYVKFVD